MRRNTYFHQVNNKYLAIEGDLTDNKHPKLNSSNRKSQKRNNKIQSTNDFLNLLNVYKPEIIKIENLNNPLSKLRKIRDYILNNMPQISIKTKIKARLFKDVLPEGYICKEEIKVDNSTFIVNCIPPSFKEFGNKIYLENIHPKSSVLSNSVETSSPKNIDKIAFCILQWDNTENTTQCVDSLLGALNESGSKIIIFDNKSLDIKEQVKLFCDFINEKRVVFVSSRSRLSFVDGFNTSAKFAQLLEAKFVYFLNNDTYGFSKGIDTATIQTFQDSKVAMAGHRVLDCNGMPRHDSCKVKSGVSFPTPTEGYALRLSHFSLVGEFNTNLKIYREDIDLINKVHSFGLRIVLDVSKSFIHKGGGSTGKLIFLPIFYRVRNFIWFDNLNNLSDVKKIFINLYLYTQIRIKNYKGKAPFFIVAISMNLIFLYALFCGLILRFIKPFPYKNSLPFKITNS